MPLLGIVRTLGTFLLLGVVGLMIGCSGESSAPPVDTGAGKQVREEMKAERTGRRGGAFAEQVRRTCRRSKGEDERSGRRIMERRADSIVEKQKGGRRRASGAASASVLVVITLSILHQGCGLSLLGYRPSSERGRPIRLFPSDHFSGGIIS